MMRYLLLLLLAVAGSCESHSFESDRRQLVAKDEIRRQLKKAHSLDITAFSQDTVPTYPDSTFAHPIRYSFDFQYLDSSDLLQKKKGVVLFTSDGRSVIKSYITDRN